LKQDNDYTEKKILNAHLATIERDIKNCRNLCSLYKAPVNESPVMSANVDITESSLLELPSASLFYELAPNREKNTLELDNTGETFDAPYSFVASMIFKHEEIYDKEGA
jgi:hypothetical protein